MKRFHAILTGKVQGVFFRATAQQQASARGIQGFVRNLPDGSVEIEAQGPEHRLDDFLLWCRSGPPEARVDGVELDWMDPSSSDSEKPVFLIQGE